MPRPSQMDKGSFWFGSSLKIYSAAYVKAFAYRSGFVGVRQLTVDKFRGGCPGLRRRLRIRLDSANHCGYAQEQMYAASQMDQNSFGYASSPMSRPL